MDGSQRSPVERPAWPLPESLDGLAATARLRDWEEADVFKELWRAFLEQLDEKGLLQWDEVFVDGTFAPAKKGAPAWEKPSGAREQSAWWWPMVRVYLSEFSPHLRHRQRSNYWSRRLRK